MEALRDRDTKGMNRRNFLKLAGLAAAGGALNLTASSSCQAVAEESPAMDPGLPDEAFWKTVQDQFILEEGVKSTLDPCCE